MTSTQAKHLRRQPAATVALLLGALLAGGGCAAQYHQYDGCVAPCGYTAQPPLPFENYAELPCPDPSPRYCFPVDRAPEMKAATGEKRPQPMKPSSWNLPLSRPAEQPVQGEPTPPKADLHLQLRVPSREKQPPANTGL